jgi:hypothetical protein
MRLRDLVEIDNSESPTVPRINPHNVWRGTDVNCQPLRAFTKGNEEAPLWECSFVNPSDFVAKDSPRRDIMSADAHRLAGPAVTGARNPYCTPGEVG